MTLLEKSLQFRRYITQKFFERLPFVFFSTGKDYDEFSGEKIGEWTVIISRQKKTWTSMHLLPNLPWGWDTWKSNNHPRQLKKLWSVIQLVECFRLTIHNSTSVQSDWFLYNSDWIENFIKEISWTLENKLALNDSKPEVPVSMNLSPFLPPKLSTLLLTLSLEQKIWVSPLISILL